MYTFLRIIIKFIVRSIRNICVSINKGVPVYSNKKKKNHNNPKYWGAFLVLHVNIYNVCRHALAVDYTLSSRIHKEKRTK